MRRILMVMLLCLMPTVSFAQSAPSITITPPRVETSGVTVKQVAVVVAALVAGSVVGQWVIGSTVGTWIGAAAGGIAGLWAYDEYGDTIEDF